MNVQATLFRTVSPSPSESSLVDMTTASKLPQPTKSSPFNTSQHHKHQIASWQRDASSHLGHRRQILYAIHRILRPLTKTNRSKWRKNLPEVCKRMEFYLYREAPSLEEYMDNSTLRQRLKKVAAIQLHRANRLKRRTQSLSIQPLTAFSDPVVVIPEEHIYDIKMNPSSANGQTDYAKTWIVETLVSVPWRFRLFGEK